MKKWEKQYRNKLSKIANSNYQNKEIVLEYIRSKQSENLSFHRLTRIADFLWHLLVNFKFDFSKMTQREVEDILLWIRKQKWSDWTKYSYFRILKNFLSWLKEERGIEVNLKKITIKKPKNSIMPEYLISEEEFNKLLNATDDLQTKTLIGILYESGARIGEILSLKIKNVTFNEYGARILVRGKTGERIIPIVWFANSLAQFIESHPLKEKPEAFLWFYFDKNNQIKPLKYEIFRARLKRLCKKVGIKKRIYTHLFRHTRLTELAKELPEQLLKVLAGWSPDSKMAKTYIHLSGKDIEESLLTKVYGIPTKDVRKEEKLRTCPKCKEANPYFAKICQRCKTPLDEKKLMKLMLNEDQIKEINDWAEVFLAFLKVMEKKYPGIWEEMRKIIESKGKTHLLK